MLKDNHMLTITNYLEKFTTDRPAWAQKLETYAKNHRVPIIDPLSLNVLLQYVRILQPQAILEIGTAIGYSALSMHDVVPNATIMTIEKNEAMYKIAKTTIETMNKVDKIQLIHDDAMNAIEQLPIDEQFDFVFIDAAKKQYKNYFTAVHPHVKKGGIIFSDNVLFRGYVAANDTEQIPDRFVPIAKSLQAYNAFVLNHEAYHSTLIPLGDGLLISVKK